MNKNLQLINETPGLACVWGASGDAGRPLECKWVEQAPEKSQSPGEQDEKHSAAAKAYADFLGLVCWLTPVTFTAIGFSLSAESALAAGKEKSRQETGETRQCA